MAINTYATLLTAIANFSSYDNLTSRLPEFIALTEAKLNRALRVRQMMSATTDTMSSSAITLPPDWLAFESVWYTASGKRYELQNIPIQEVNRFDEGDTGHPTGYYIAGSTVTFFPTTDSNYSVGYVYYQSIPALTSANTTNWLLTSHPDIYLSGTLLELAIHQKDQDEIAFQSAQLQSLVMQLSKSDIDKKSGGSLAARCY